MWILKALFATEDIFSHNFYTKNAFICLIHVFYFSLILITCTLPLVKHSDSDLTDFTPIRHYKSATVTFPGINLQIFL